MWLILLILALTIFIYFIKRNYSYWSDRGVPGPSTFFFLKTIWPIVTMKTNMGIVSTGIYKKYKEYPFVGVYRIGTPCLLVRDPELIKVMVVRDFKNFMDNDIIVDKKVDPILGRNPFVLKGEEWKHMRALMTPCFTSGKMKFVYPLVEEVSKNMINYIEKYLKETNGSPLHAKELCTKFTVDSVASCAFGLDGKSFADPEAEFRKLAHRFMSAGNATAIKFTLAMLIPKLINILSIKLVEKEVEDKLREIVKNTIEYRDKNNVVRNDFLQGLIELRKKNFTLDDITGQAAGFFGDGFETSSIVMSFTLYELSRHPEAQDKLRAEIQREVEKNGGVLSYESIQNMNYLHAVIYETLRLTPIIHVLQKTCTEEFSYTSETEGYEKLSVNIEQGIPVFFPVAGLQTDPKHFPQPEVFRPERFLEENKDSYNKYTFMSFGEGPRYCLGQRFGLLQIKVGIANVIRYFKLTLNNKTQLPLKFDPTYIMPSPIGGLWLNFEKIN